MRSPRTRRNESSLTVLAAVSPNMGYNSSPLVTLLLLLFFALPNVGIAIGPISAAILALVMNTAAFNCEVWRASLMNFPKDQYEAAQSVGMGAGLRFRRIVLPSILPGILSGVAMAPATDPRPPASETARVNAGSLATPSSRNSAGSNCTRVSRDE